MKSKSANRRHSIKRIICGLAVIARTAGLAGCGSTVDSTDDPLSAYNVDSLLPFSTRDPSLATDTPAPNATSGSAVGSTATPAPTRVIPTATINTYTRIEPGDTGDNVLALQRRLIQLGYLTGTPDGTYGTQTQNAIKLFQKALGISQTGIANVSLQERLFSENAPTYAAANATATPGRAGSAVNANTGTGTVNTPSTVQTTNSYSTLVRGDSGEAVKALQRRLQELGYLNGSADGQFGAMTERAVKAFQASLGLTQSGVASASLQERLYASNAPYAPVTAAPTARPTARPTQAPTAQPTYNPYGGYVELTYGTKNSLAVQQMQNRLKVLGYFSATATGNYYSETSAAVSAFQSAMGLEPTGKATPETLYLLYSNAAVPHTITAAPTQPAVTAAPNPTISGFAELSRGSRGSEVISLQKRLIVLGWATGSADGIYGQQTVDAVMRFQRAIGYEQTGVATPEMQAILFSSVAPQYSPTAAPTSVPTATPTQAPVVTAEPQPTARYTRLGYNDSGDSVKALQQRLKDLGYFSGNVAGHYLEKTQSAVTLFQAALGWPQDGQASAELQDVLFSDVAPAYGGTETGYTPLVRGDSGVQVRNMQTRLRELGYLSGSADGSYGSGTEAAVKAFQQAAGLPADGSASLETLDRLYAWDAPEAPIPTAEPTTVPPVETAAPIVIETVPPEQPMFSGLQRGDSGDDVRMMQQRLRDLGYFEGDPTGNYYDATADAVRRFQAAIGWGQDGVATSELLERLYAADAPEYSAPVYVETPTEAPVVTAAPAEPVEPQSGYQDLYPNDSGDRVKAIQRRLQDLGYFTGEIGGNYLAKTQAAVEAFQAAIGWPVDGVATAALQERLFADDAPANPGLMPLSSGDKGPAVERLQARLIQLGYLDDTEENRDGDYGPMLSGAVERLQRLMGRDEALCTGAADVDFLVFLYSDEALNYASFG